MQQQDTMREQFNTILAFMPVHEHLYTSGQPTAEQLNLIKENGFSTIINLALTDASNHLPFEDRICLELGLDYIQIPLLWDCPNSSAALLALDLVDHLVREQQVWLHCAKNFRVSSLMYLYRQYYMGMNIAEADALLQQIWQPNETWTGLMHALQLQLQARQSTKEIEQLS
ncbi:protein tyrosine phosphatase family protein [Acinetobacter puyangensis]|uniref:protein tyrosine phosphatase family protein n=1 Tax=Acinetobacter puyangensis TaxID=1096779 RepID=UPI003A4DAC82